MIAITASPGMPRLRVGTKAACAAALLEASGEAMPSMAPLPNRSGVRESLFFGDVGDEGSDGRAGARQNAREGTDTASRAPSARRCP